MSQLIRTSRGHIQSQHITHTEIRIREYDDKPNMTILDIYLTSQEEGVQLRGEEAEQFIKWLDNQSCPVYLLGESEKI